MLIAIFGTGRNGSTLLSHLLDGIPNAYVHTVEINFLSVWSDLATVGHVRRDTIQNATRRPLRGLERRLPTKLLLDFYGDQVRQIETDYMSQVDPFPLGRHPLEKLQEKSNYGLREFTVDFLQACSDWVNNGDHKEHLIFKTIDVAYIPEHAAIYPGMKYIHLVRDPMTMYSSQKRSLMCNKAFPSWHLGRDNFETMFDMRWIPHAKAIVENRNNKDHYLIRYEDMTQNALKEIGGICDWLGLPLPPEPTKQTTLGGKFMKKIHVKPSKKGVETPVEVQANMGKKLGYEEVLTERERQLIVLKTKSIAPKLGYSEGPASVSKLGIMKLWLLPDRWEFIHTHRAKGVVRSIWSFFFRRLYLIRSLLSHEAADSQ